MGGKKNNGVGAAQHRCESCGRAVRRLGRGPGRAVVVMISAALGVTAFGSVLHTPEKKDKNEERKLGRKLIRGTTTDADEDIMEKIIRLMDQTARRLEVGFDSGEKTQALQQEVLKQLDNAIKLAAAQTRKSSGQQKNYESDRRRRKGQNQDRKSNESRNTKVNSRKGESSDTAPSGRKPTAGGPGEGSAESRRGWGNLPQRERDEVIQGAGERYLERYRRWIEQYYRALQEARE